MRTGVPCNENRFFPVGIGSQGVPCELYRVWVCSVVHHYMYKIEETFQYLGALCQVTNQFEEGIRSFLSDISNLKISLSISILARKHSKV